MQRYEVQILDSYQNRTYADGVNFCNGARNCRVEFSHLRNTGDVSFASHHEVISDLKLGFMYVPKAADSKVALRLSTR